MQGNPGRRGLPGPTLVAGIEPKRREFALLIGQDRRCFGHLIDGGRAGGRAIIYKKLASGSP